MGTEPDDFVRARAAAVAVVVLLSVSSVSSTRVPPDYSFTTIAGVASIGSTDGPGNIARFQFPSGIAVASTGVVYVADTNNHTIRKISTNGDVSTFAGMANNPGSANGTGTMARFSYPIGLAIDASDNLYVAEGGGNAIPRASTNRAVWRSPATDRSSSPIETTTRSAG